MPDKTIEKAARAMCVGRDPDDITGGPHPGGPWLDEGEPWWTGYIEQATFALRTTLEPSEGEIEQGAKAICVADDEPWDELGETAKDYAPFGYSPEWYRRMARACLIAAARVRVG